VDAQRRIFLAALAASASASALPVVPAGGGKAAYPFSLGVASGSPLPNAVVIWTRILHDPLNAAEMPPVAFAVRWEVAEDERFSRIVAKGTASAAPQLAHSVHVDVAGLSPARWYWYRFMLGDAVSPIGRTRTAPAADTMPDQLKLAVASCQHWEFGTYAAHRHIAAASPDLVAFLGDYIYDTRELTGMDMQPRMSYCMDIDMQVHQPPWLASKSSSTHPFARSSKTITFAGSTTQ
jgi:alkaline phosphatase D